MLSNTIRRLLPFPYKFHARKVSQLEADNEALKEQLQEHDDYYRKVVNDECAPDEIHCTCVPALRDKIDQLEADNVTLQRLREQEECERNDLEADNARLREALKSLLDRALPHEWRGTIEIQCTPEEYQKAKQFLQGAE